MDISLGIAITAFTLLTFVVVSVPVAEFVASKKK